MRRFLPLLTVVIVVLALAALFSFGLTPRNVREVASPNLGKPMPDFEMPLFERYRAQYGDTFTFSEMQGTPLVVNFWASWCYPACYNEAPILEAAWQEHQSEVLFVGVDTQDKKADAVEFLDQFGLSFPNGVDTRSRIGIEWGLFGVPETFFIRADGTLSYRHTGEINREQLEAQLSAILPKP